MTRPRVNYDRIAPEYDRRYGPGRSAGIEQALVRRVGASRRGPIVEVGCGTGHWLAALRAVAPEVCGLDPAAGMLGQARRRRLPLQLLRGVAERLPLAGGAFALVFCVHALHHFDDPRAFIREAYRALAPGGTLAVLGTDPHGQKDSWYGFEFFAGAYEAELRRVPTWAAVAGWLAEAGFRQVELESVERIAEARLGRKVFEDPFLAKGSCSRLALLTDEAYQAGLRRIEAAIGEAEARGETAVFYTDIRVEMLSGRKAPESPVPNGGRAG